MARIPRTEQEIIDFIGNQFISMTEADNPCDVRYSLTVHELQSAFEMSGFYDDPSVFELEPVTNPAYEAKLPCQNKDMGEHACSDRSQCWEPCGELGHSAEHARPAPVEVQNAINEALEATNKTPEQAIQEKLTQLQVGKCTCMTKTPVIEYHERRCTYRLAVELGELLGVVNLAHEVMKDDAGTLLDENKRLAGRIEFLEQELEETDKLNQRLAHICSMVAIALKGQEAPLEGHDWSDLAECVNVLQAGYDGLKKDLERLGRRY